MVEVCVYKYSVSHLDEVLLFLVFVNGEWGIVRENWMYLTLQK